MMNKYQKSQIRLFPLTGRKLKISRLFILAMLCASALLSPVAGHAQSPPPAAASPGAGSAEDEAAKRNAREEEYQAALAASIDAGVEGPATIPLLAQGEMVLPEGYIFVPKDEAARFLRALGNSTSDSLLGLVFGSGDWFAIISFFDAGYIRDDDARTWDADAMLKHFVDSNEAANKDRSERGFPAFHVTGWIEKPTYDETRHHLVWSVGVSEENQPLMKSAVNYNTLALGREGYFSLLLVTSAATVAADKADAAILLNSIRFVDGKTYADFEESTDTVAAYGLAALVAGIGAKKLGLIAILVGFLGKFAHVLLIPLAVAGAGAFRWLRSRFGRSAT